VSAVKRQHFSPIPFLSTFEVHCHFYQERFFWNYFSRKLTIPSLKSISIRQLAYTITPHVSKNTCHRLSPARFVSADCIALDQEGLRLITHSLASGTRVKV